MKAKWHGQPYHDYAGGKWLISFETSEPPTIYDKTKDAELSLEIKKREGLRGQNANRYFWELVGEIAKEMNIDKLEVHDKMLADNIHYFYKDGAFEWMSGDFEPNQYGFVKFMNKDGQFDYWKDANIEVMLAKPGGGYYMADGAPKRSKVFFHVKGSRVMTTKEMSALIDSTVEEAKALGIETMTPKELERLKALWKPKAF